MKIDLVSKIQIVYSNTIELTVQRESKYELEKIEQFILNMDNLITFSFNSISSFEF